MPRRDVDVVIFDAMGVTFKESDDVNNLLIPFIERECGYENREAIRQLYATASLGRISSKGFWEQVGCEYPDIEKQYLDTQLMIDPDFIPVAERLKNGYTLSMLSNDVSEWSAYLRKRFDLDRLFTSVIISGDYGYRKPDPRLYEILLKSLGIASHRCLFIDDQPRNLDTAVRLGIKTVYRLQGVSRAAHRYDYEIGTLKDLLTLL
jgi:putative hydrolase of the HAD superfamily